MTLKVYIDMIDTTVTEHFRFKVINPDNFYSITTPGKVLPSIDTLIDLSCYETIPSSDKFEAYRLKSFIKTSTGYQPGFIEIRDIPFASRQRFRLVINVSHPKVIYGHNLNEIYEYQFFEIVDEVYTMLLQFGIEIDKKELFNTSNLRRVDYCKNIIIFTSVKNFIALLRKLKKPRSITYTKYDETIYFGTRKKKTCIYNKIYEIISKASHDKNDVTYQLANQLNMLQSYSGIHVIRVEQRLFGLPAIKEELKEKIAPKDITFKSLFSEKIASYILDKHWQKIASEEKFKILILGENDLHSILHAFANATSEQQIKTVNPLYAIYTKLLADVGEEVTSSDIKGMKKARTIVKYKKELYALVKQIPLFDKRLEDYITIKNALVNWDKFSIPNITQE